MGQQVYGNYVIGFSEKILVWPKWDMVGLKMKPPHNVFKFSPIKKLH